MYWNNELLHLFPSNQRYLTISLPNLCARKKSFTQVNTVNYLNNVGIFQTCMFDGSLKYAWFLEIVISKSNQTHCKMVLILYWLLCCIFQKKYWFYKMTLSFSDSLLWSLDTCANVNVIKCELLLIMMYWSGTIALLTLVITLIF